MTSFPDPSIKFPFDIEPDELSIIQEVIIPSFESLVNLETKFKEFVNKYGGYEPVRCAPEGGFEPRTMVSIRVNRIRNAIWNYQEKMRHEHELKERRNRNETIKKQFMEELGEFRTIGRKTYIVKNGAVYDVKYIPVQYSTGITPFQQLYAHNHELPRLTTEQINSIRGNPLFNSVDEAVTYWEQIEEAIIINEAKKRLDAEHKKLVVDRRETRIRETMDTLRVHYIPEVVVPSSTSIPTREELKLMLRGNI